MQEMVRVGMGVEGVGVAAGSGGGGGGESGAAAAAGGAGGVGAAAAGGSVSDAAPPSTTGGNQLDEQRHSGVLSQVLREAYVAVVKQGLLMAE